MAFKDIPVVLVGHGSETDDNSENCIIIHSRILEERRIFRSVRASFIKQRPNVCDVIGEIPGNTIILVPMLMSEGFIFDVLLRNLKNQFNVYFQCIENCVAGKADKTVVVCRPLGTHDLISEVIKHKVREVLEFNKTGKMVNEEDISLFIAGHGTLKDERSRLSLEYHVRKLLREKIYKSVRGCFLDEEPLITRVYELAESENIVVVPFFATKGPHVCEDIPILLGEERREVVRRLEKGMSGFVNPTVRNNKVVWYADPVGCDFRILDIIIRCVVEKLCENDVQKLF